MNLEQAKKRLKKINRLIDTIEPDDSSTSRLERDLLLNYLRELYECILDDSDPVSVSRESTEKKSVPSPNYSAGEKSPKSQNQGKKEEPLLFDERPEENAKQQESREPAKEAAPTKTESEKKHSTRQKAQNTVVEQEQESAKKSVAESPKSQPEEVETLVAEEVENEPEVEELFTIKKANEISEKLSQLPISDLNRAMGVNEKIFVKNELFAGDDIVFKQVIQKLNTLNSFEDAKNFLSSEVAYTYRWAEPEKKNKAKNFIQLVYRRYKDN
jgi:DNA primase